MSGSTRGWGRTAMWMRYCGTAGKPGGTEKTNSILSWREKPAYSPVLRSLRRACDGVAKRHGRRAAGAQWQSRWRVDFGDWDVPKSITMKWSPPPSNSAS